MKTDAPILVVGAGSIGERHIGVLQTLGYKNLYVFRQRNLPLRAIDPGSVRIITDWAQVEAIKPAAAIICSPTAQHTDQTLDCLKLGMHVLVEKPLSHQLNAFGQLRACIVQNDRYVQVAYMLRYHPLMKRLKMMVENQTLGQLLSVQSYWGEYLPDWHPWEDYRSSYAARQDMGGGAALTLSHDLDIVTWLSGSFVETWHTLKNYTSALEINTEAGADVNIGFASGMRAHCHLNFFEQVPRRFYRLVFDGGSAELDYFKNELIVQTKNNKEVFELPNFDRNEMFEAQTRFFLAQCNHPNRVQLALRYVEESEQIIKMCN